MVRGRFDRHARKLGPAFRSDGGKVGMDDPSSVANAPAA